ncbi:hypothetical protein HK57_00043 [Aspergillus ustus]|uniref:Enoyl reductase (ER) domain-containing protein n=1 Tax=Aspergillus ustus TaxID=40382 RepID=A0A0C1EFN5_ASPUT|nr:hypothetical protein HK57_00043 [Aspergillus ustus]
MAPPSIFAWQYASTKGGLEENLQFYDTFPMPEMPSNSGTVASIIRVLAVSLNPQDYKVPEMGFAGKMATRPPATPASDFVGRIHKTNVPGLSKDNIVCGTIGMPQKHGSLAEYILVLGAEGVVKVPEGFVQGPGNLALKLQQLSCVGVAGLTALQTLDGVREGSRIFINGGSGGTGSFAIQIAKHALGCAEVTASCSPANVTYLRDLGADVLIDYRAQDVIQALNQHVSQTGQGFDRVIDFVGNDMEMYWQSPGFLKEDGKYVLVGTDSMWELARNMLKISLLPKVLGGGQRKFQLMQVKLKKSDMERLAGFVFEGKVRPVVESVFALTEVPKAFKELRTGKRRGKLVVQVADPARG